FDSDSISMYLPKKDFKPLHLRFLFKELFAKEELGFEDLIRAAGTTEDKNSRGSFQRLGENDSCQVMGPSTLFCPGCCLHWINLLLSSPLRAMLFSFCGHTQHVYKLIVSLSCSPAGTSFCFQ
ncbi:hypothetical protein KUCAC02_032539, partial [Chaenocephalus aceratus]